MECLYAGFSKNMEIFPLKVRLFLFLASSSFPPPPPVASSSTSEVDVLSLLHTTAAGTSELGFLDLELAQSGELCLAGVEQLVRSKAAESGQRVLVAGAREGRERIGDGGAWVESALATDCLSAARRPNLSATRAR